MGCVKADNLILPYELPVTSAQLLYPVLSLICLILLVQRIKHRRPRTSAVLGPGRQTRKYSSDMPGGEDKEACEGSMAHYNNNRQQSSIPNDRGIDISHHTAFGRLPSACDVLQPLSQRTPLPPSGQLAAVLSRERRALTPAATEDGAGHTEALVGPTPALSNHAALGGGSHRSSRQWIDEEARNTNSPNNKGLSPSLSGVPVMDAQSTTSNGLPTTNYERSGDTDESGSDMAPVATRRRSETVQHLQDVDENGVRTWKRLTVQYN